MSLEENRAAGLPEDVVAALVAGNKIEAIKRLRTARNMGLKEAKEAVEAYVPTDPLVKARMAEAAERSRRGCLTWLGVVVVAALIVAAVLRMRG